VLPYSAEATEGLAADAFMCVEFYEVLGVSSGHNFKYCYMNLYLKREAIYSNYMDIKVEVSR